MLYITNPKTGIEHIYNIGFATPVEFLNDMLQTYGEEGVFKDYESALEFVISGLDTEAFLTFCDEKNSK